MKKIIFTTILGIFCSFTQNLFSQKISNTAAISNDTSVKSRLFLDLGNAFKNGTFSFEEFKKLDSLKVKVGLSENATSNAYHVASYKVTMLGKKTNGPKVIVNNSSSLSCLKSTLELLGDGDILQISDIRVINNTGEAIQIDNFATFIKTSKE